MITKIGPKISTTPIRNKKTSSFSLATPHISPSPLSTTQHTAPELSVFLNTSEWDHDQIFSSLEDHISTLETLHRELFRGRISSHTLEQINRFSKNTLSSTSLKDLIRDVQLRLKVEAAKFSLATTNRE